MNIAYLAGYHSAKDSLATHDLYKEYFMSPEGSVPWQLERLREE